jgi:hypothetical protein
VCVDITASFGKSLRIQSDQRCSLVTGFLPQKTHLRPVGSEVVAAKKPQPTQRTQPKKGEPVEIPVPTRQSFIRNLNRAIRADPEKVEPKSKRVPRDK